MPDTWYKAALVGTFEGQAIVNVLYYGGDDYGPFPEWSPLIAGDLGLTLATQLVPDYLDCMCTGYTLTSVSVTGVNARGVTISDYAVDYPVGDPGTIAVDTEGQAQVAIVGFRTLTTGDAARNVKRSYLALGPLTQSAQNAGGAISAGFLSASDPFVTLLASPLDGVAASYGPVRIGRTVDPAPIAIGRVLDATVRPYASFRKSRKRRPSG